MAENDELQEQDEGAEEGTEAKRGGVIPLVAALVISVGGGGFVGMKALGPSVGPWMAERAANASEKGGGSHGGGGHAGGGEESPLHMVDNLVLNPARSGGSRFLLTSVALEANSAAAADMLASRDVELRDAFIMVLGAMTVEELTDISNRPAISQKLLYAAEALVGYDVVHRLFIPQFVIQ